MESPASSRARTLTPEEPLPGVVTSMEPPGSAYAAVSPRSEIAIATKSW